MGSLSERHRTLEVGSLPVSDEFAATCTAALLDALVAKKVAVTRRATQEFTGACLLEAFGDGFACFLHEKSGKEEENIDAQAPCKALIPHFLWAERIDFCSMHRQWIRYRSLIYSHP